jgi:cyclohexanone monooxygenase
VADGVVAGGQHYPLDMLVLATGFHAITGAIAAIAIRGADGQSLRDEWAEGTRSYLGLMVAGFPNLFMITGPGSPSVISNVILSIEQHVDWIADCLVALRERGASRIVPTDEAERQWMEHVDAAAHQTLFPQAPDTWYHGRTREGRKMFLPYVGGVGAYRVRCAAIARDGYTGFAISREAVTA